MSITREEAIEVLENGGWWDSLIPVTTIEGRIEDDKLHEALDIALSALRPVSREAWTAEWTVDEFGHKCSKCGEYLPDGEDVRKPQFCPECGRAMTDEAVDMVMERLEEMDNGTIPCDNT